MGTAIEWTDETWNPITGCTKVSPGCAYCYAERVDHRYDHDKVGKLPWALSAARGGRMVTLHHDRLDQPLHWRKPRMVFVNSMSDLFHEDVPDSYILTVFTVMQRAAQHTFQVLTKRPERALSLLSNQAWIDAGERTARYAVDASAVAAGLQLGPLVPWAWPLPNVWMGVSVENQRWADVRLLLLAQIPAAVRFVSCEPLLGPVDLRPWLGQRTWVSDNTAGLDRPGCLDWVIVGGESGGPDRRSLMDGYPTERWRPRLDQVRTIRDDCLEASVPFFFKQWGGATPKAAGRLLEGRTWLQFPDTVVREGQG